MVIDRYAQLDWFTPGMGFKEIPGFQANNLIKSSPDFAFILELQILLRRIPYFPKLKPLSTPFVWFLSVNTTFLAPGARSASSQNGLPTF